jgi:hypothetical protein
MRQCLLQNVIDLIGKFFQPVALAADPAAQTDVPSAMFDHQWPAAILAGRDRLAR